MTRCLFLALGGMLILVTFIPQNKYFRFPNPKIECNTITSELGTWRESNPMTSQGFNQGETLVISAVTTFPNIVAETNILFRIVSGITLIYSRYLA